MAAKNMDGVSTTVQNEDDANDVWSDIEDELLLQCDSEICSKQAETSEQKRSRSDGDRGDDRGDDSSLSKQRKLLAPLHAFRRGYLWVSDLCSQCWCEQQMEYRFTLPVVLVEDPVMTEGSNLHLARELEVQDVVQVKVTSDEDIFAVKVMNFVGAIDSFLTGTPVRREIPIFGAPFDEDVFLVGMIDEIRCDQETFDFDILELKTRSTRSLPSRAQKDTHAIQVMIYKKLFDDLIKGKTNKDMLKRHLGLKMDKPFGPGIKDHLKMQGLKASNLDDLLDYTYDRLKCIPCVSQMLIEYCFQEDKATIGIETVEYDDEWLKEKFQFYVQYWKGKRDVVGVEIEDAWKCQRCDFADVCQWRQLKAKECRKKNKIKL